MSIMILAGGRSSRLGQDKARMVLAGKNLLEQLVDRLGLLGEEIILVLAPQQPCPRLMASPRIKFARDQVKGKGPLIGLCAGLKAASDPQSLAVACDMPFLNLDLIRYMMGVSEGFDITIPRISDMVEPMHAIYNKSCLPQIEDMINNNQFKPYKLMDMVRVRYVEQEEIDRFDPRHLSLFNINTEADYQKAEEILSNQGGRP